MNIFIVQIALLWGCMCDDDENRSSLDPSLDSRRGGHYWGEELCSNYSIPDNLISEIFSSRYSSSIILGNTTTLACILNRIGDNKELVLEAFSRIRTGGWFEITHLQFSLSQNWNSIRMEIAFADRMKNAVNKAKLVMKSLTHFKSDWDVVYNAFRWSRYTFCFSDFVESRDHVHWALGWDGTVHCCIDPKYLDVELMVRAVNQTIFSFACENSYFLENPKVLRSIRNDALIVHPEINTKTGKARFFFTDSTTIPFFFLTLCIIVSIIFVFWMECGRKVSVPMGERVFVWISSFSVSLYFSGAASLILGEFVTRSRLEDSQYLQSKYTGGCRFGYVAYGSRFRACYKCDSMDFPRPECGFIPIDGSCPGGYFCPEKGEYLPCPFGSSCPGNEFNRTEYSLCEEGKYCPDPRQEGKDCANRTMCRGSGLRLTDPSISWIWGFLINLCTSFLYAFLFVVLPCYWLGLKLIPKRRDTANVGTTSLNTTTTSNEIESSQEDPNEKSIEEVREEMKREFEKEYGQKMADLKGERDHLASVVRNLLEEKEKAKEEEETEGEIEDEVKFLGERKSDLENLEEEQIEKMLEKNKSQMNALRKRFDEAKTNLEITKNELVKNLCTLCYERRKNHTLIPCGHVYCGVCSKKVKICPACRVEVIGRTKMYL